MSSRVTPDRPATWPDHIRQRYGVTDRPRWVVPVLVGVLVLAAVGVTAMAAQLVDPPIAAGVTSYQTIADDHMTIEFQVQRRASAPATCVLRARAHDGFDVAYAVVELPADQGRTMHTYELRTAYRPFVGELLGCGIDGPPENVTGAQFRPGVVAPEQPWTQPAG